jgi:peptidyl-prolyl cis-trans isomerase D
MALAFFRRHQWVLKWFLGLVVVSFVILYIPALTGQGGGQDVPNETVARVGDDRITAGEFQKAYFRRQQDLTRQTHRSLDAATMRRLGIPDQVFEYLVEERLMLQEAHRLGVSVDDDAVVRSVENDPKFQRNGKFIGGNEFKGLLEMNGLNPDDFFHQTRELLLQRKLEDLVTAGVSVSEKEVEREYRRRNEQVKVAYVFVDAARFKGQVAVSDEEARARFNEKKDSYKIPEKRVVSYVLVEPQAFESRITVTPGEIQAFYDTHKDDFRQEEQVCASHILFKVKDTPEVKVGHEDAEAKRMAGEVLQKLKGGADFAELAKKTSEDEGSKQSGGDLQCFPRGRMVADFEKAAFALDPGQLSDVVKSKFGYHVIKLNSRSPESLTSLEQARPRIQQTLLAERGQERAEEASQAVAAKLASSGSLEEAAKGQGLKVQQSTPFARGDNPDPISSPALVNRAFELQKKGDVAKEPFQVQRGYAFIALSEVKAAHKAEWAEVSDKVKAEVLEAGEMERAQKTALEVRKSAEGPGLEKGATAHGLVRKESQRLVGRGEAMGDLAPSASLDAVAFTLPDKTLSEPVAVAGGYAILQVLERKPFDPAAFDTAKKSFKASLESQARSKLYEAYMGEVRRKASVEKVASVYRRLTS